MQKRVAQYPQGLKTANMSECCDLCKPGNTIGCTVWIFRKLDGSSGMCWPMAYVHGTRHVVGNVIGGTILPAVEQTYSCWLRGEVIIKQCMSSATFSTYTTENNGTWEDIDSMTLWYAVHEWSADCNGDGLVDYGQILDGSLNDVNKDGVPDECGPFVACCIGSTCISASSFACQQAGGTFENSDAGCSSQVCPSDCPGDITDDGQVDFTDLLIIVSTWGPCSDG